MYLRLSLWVRTELLSSWVLGGKDLVSPLGHKWETGSMLRVWGQTLDSSSKKAARVAGIFQLRGKKTGRLETIAGVGGPTKISN